MHIHKIEFDYGNFGFGSGWHCIKCGKVYKNKPKLNIFIGIMIKKLIKLFHKHKFKTLPPQDYFVNGIDTSSRGAIAYQETGKRIIRTCKCGMLLENKINVIRKYDR